MRIYHISSRIVLAKFGDNERTNYLKQGIPEDVMNLFIGYFDVMRKSKYKELYMDIDDVTIPKDRRDDITAYADFSQLVAVVNFVRGNRQTKNANSKAASNAPPIFENDKLSIYRGDTPKQCVDIKGDFNYTWCVCAKGASNLYNYYHYSENNGYPTFYFVKSKTLPQENPYFFIAIQVTNKGQYKVTRWQNDGDRLQTWDEISISQPDLAELQNIFVYKSLDKGELEFFNKYESNPISDTEFKKLVYDDREKYLDMFGQKRPVSQNIFKNLSDDLKSRYIDYEIGLEEDKFELIKDNKRLLGRYRQITKRKIDKFIKAKQEKTDRYLKISLNATELDVLGKEESDVLFANIDDENIISLLSTYNKDKNNLIKSVINAKGEKLSTSTIKRLLEYSENTDEISMLIIGVKKSSLTSSDIVEILRYSKDKDATIESIFSHNDNLKDVSNMPYFIEQARDENRIANVFLQNISKEQISSLSDKSMSILINSINDKKRIFEILGKESINKLSESSITEILKKEFSSSDDIINIIIEYRGDNLTGNNVFYCIFRASEKYEVAKKLGSKNINKLSDEDVHSFLLLSDSATIQRIIFEFKTLTHGNIYSLLSRADNLEEAIKILGADKIRALTDEEANRLIILAKDKSNVAEVLLKYRTQPKESPVSQESTISSSESVYDQRIYNIFQNIYKNINWKQRSTWIENKQDYYSIFAGINASDSSSVPSYVIKVNISPEYKSVTVDVLLNKTMSPSLANLSNVMKIEMHDMDSNQLRTYIINRFGFNIKLPYEFKKEIKINKKSRFTRNKDGKLTSMELYVVPTQNGYEIYYEIINLKTSAKEARKVLKNKNSDGTELTAKQASRLFDLYIEQAKNMGYKDQDSREYITEGIMDISEMEKSVNPPEVPNKSPVVPKKDQKKMKTAQGFDGFYTGNVPDYAAQFLGTSSVESSQINSMFGKANDAVNLVNQFDSSLLYNISFIFNFAKSGAYGVYLSELDRAIKTKALQNKLEQKGYTVQSVDKGLTAFPKQNTEITQEQIQQDIDNLYQDLESKGGTAIGINMGAVLSAAKQDAMESGSKDLEMWQWIAVLHLGGTIAHEAIHAKGSRGEGPSEQVEQRFTNWALPKINEEYKKSLESQGKSEEYTPLIITNRQRHASGKSWYKKAQLSYYMPSNTSNDATGSDLNGRFPDNLNSDEGWNMLAQQDQGIPIENRLGRQFMSKIPKGLDQEHNSLEEQLRKYTKGDKKLDPHANMEELLSEGWDEDRGYIGLEGLLDEKRPKPLMVPIDKTASSFNLKKYAQDWYTEEVAKNTTDPKILIDILRKGNSDFISGYAAENPNCPPEMLAEILRRGKDDDVSRWAVRNLNCTPEILSEVLRRGENDSVSCTAFSHPNCPPEAKINWMRMMGKIEKEDESKGHIIEYEDNKPEDNFEDLKKLISKNKNMIKTATLFGWMNNLEISDGSTIPGLSDRVMAWDDRDECFSEEESWIKKQPRYNPTYDIKGFYYRWIEPRNQPQLFDDMTSDYSNTHPAKRFASKIDPELSKILSILSKAKSKIANKEIKCTRFVATNDMMPVIDKIFDNASFKINVFFCDNIDDNEIYSIWISSLDVNEEIIEKVEKHLQKKELDKDIDKLIDDLTGISKQTESSIKHIVELTKDVCDMYDFNMPNTDVSENNIIFIIENSDQCLKLGGIVAEKLGIIDVNINHNLLSFKYKDILVIFSNNKENLKK